MWALGMAQSPLTEIPGGASCRNIIRGLRSDLLRFARSKRQLEYESGVLERSPFWNDIVSSCCTW